MKTRAITAAAILAAVAGLAQAQFVALSVDRTNGFVANHPITTGGTNKFRAGLGSDRVEIDQTNAVRLFGAATVWEDLRFPAATAAPVTPNADVVKNNTENAITFETGCGTNRTTDDHVWIVAQMPHAWKIGSTAAPHVHWIQTAADQTSMWYMYWRWYDIGSTVTVWQFSGPATNAASYTPGQSLHQLSTFAHIAGTGISGISSIMDVKLFRDGNFGTGDVDMKEYDIHVELDSLGSNEESAK